ncbi:MAG: hypothetical protein DHS20C15_13230 [Planctomycetota bacterium]|nr:MAG: hypothetical protein DHS20C15_13230 [Planctomycetota bacterium]
MRSHLSSAIIGATAALALIGSLGAASPRGVDAPMRVAGIPAPDELVRIDEGESFEVPAGSTFVICGVASSGLKSVIYIFDVAYQVIVDGNAVLSGGLSQTFGLTSTSVSYAPGFAVPGPATVSIQNITKRLPNIPDTDIEPVLHGYLAQSR